MTKTDSIEPAAPARFQIFLSYARDDRDAAERIHAFLTDAGLGVFIDFKSISHGEDWDKAIERALKECSRMVLLLSDSSMPERDEVEREWFYFVRNRKPILPILIEDCEIHSRFLKISQIDARKGLEPQLPKLRDALLRPLDAPPPIVDSLTEYRQGRIAEWLQPRYSIEKRFVNLTLLLDQGPDQPERWQRAESLRFNDLRKVLAKMEEHPALVLLGPPGSGKSTLLRRLQLDHSRDRLEDGGAQVSFFIQLNGYRSKTKDAPLEPREWLCKRWAVLYPNLSPLDSLLQSGHALLLLDALNEMPHRDQDEFRAIAELWRDFTQEAARLGNRLLFSCRSLDYGGLLSDKELPVPQILIEQMNPDQVREFIGLYTPTHQERLWRQIDGAPQFSLFTTPYFLKLYCEQAERTDGSPPRGPAGLFTGLIRQTVEREINSPLFQQASGLFDGMDRQKITNNRWASEFDLPERGSLLRTLSDLAYEMQQKDLKPEAAHLRIGFNEACTRLGGEMALRAAEALSILDRDVATAEVLFLHQLLQEYFAARRLAKAPDPELVRVEWSAATARPPLDELLAGLAEGDPLPALPQTGWEETTFTAAAMASDIDRFVRELMPCNLPLAGRCAAVPDARVGTPLKDEIRAALLARSQDRHADLRARIAAGEALGLLGDPRFVRCSGPHGEYLLPPMVEIAAGTYPMGDDNGLYDREKPACMVTLPAFRIGQFPVTNAEYKLFIDAGGYEEKRWWDTEESLAWLNGEASTKGQKGNWYETRGELLGMSEEAIRGLTNLTPEHKDFFIEVKGWSEERFEEQLNEWFPEGITYRQPENWNDTRFNNPAKPVVGVTWYEARAYCNWLTANCGGETIYRLPIEAEFEAAARGAKGRMFPYKGGFDSGRCNTYESHIRRTTPIGIFDNATPEGAYDLSGNSYTWTLSIYDQEKFPYPYQSGDGREDIHQREVKRVLRGGSWADDPHFARVAYRFIDLPAFRSFSCGFRVVG
ncbi:MAG: SUMF1/EgtB/PvdO family nonheme iron enzyme [Blastocatellia bacterium]